MPLSATVTPLSLYMLDDTVFDGLQLPTMPQNPTSYPDLYVEGFALDREVLVNNILMETGELDCIYPDPDFFKFAVTQWSKKELPVWQELYNTIFYKYNPLWNKDGTIKETARDLTTRETSGSRSRTGSTEQDVTDTVRETDTHNLTDQRTANLRTLESGGTDNTGTQEISRTMTGQEARDGDVHTAISGQTLNTGTVQDAGTSNETETHSGNVTTSETNSTENKVSAYNDSTYQNRDKSDTTNSQTETDGRSIAKNGTSGNTRTNNLAENRTESTQVDDNSVIDTSENETTTRTDDLTSQYEQDRQETGTDTITHSGTLGRQGDNTRSTEGTEEETEETAGTEEGSLDHDLTRTETGNIGVTMTTQLIAAQRELVQFNFYDLIVERFKERFCLLVY